MTIHRFNVIDDLPRNIVADHSYPAQPCFFKSIDWFRCLHATSLPDSDKPRVYVLEDPSSKTSAMLVCVAPENLRRLSSMTNFYTVEYGLSAPACGSSNSDSLGKLIEFIAHDTPRLETVELRYLTGGDQVKNLWRRHFKKQHFSPEIYFQYENWYLRVDGQNFDKYYANRPSRLRNTIKRKEKKLVKQHKVDVVIYQDAGDDLTGAIDDYVSIYNQSWKSAEPHPAFIPAFLEQTARLGVLRLGILYIDGRAAATQIWITTVEKSTIYKLAYLSEYASYSPGSILSRDMFRHAIDVDKVCEVDYGVGSEKYKVEWMSDVREIWGIKAANLRTPRGVAVAAAQRVRSTAKAAVALMSRRQVE